MLEPILSLDVFKVLLVFARIGAVIMLMPGFGAAFVSSNIRLALALAIAVVITPLVGHTLPALPRNVPQLVVAVGIEITIGLFFGLLVQMMMAALHMSGTIISFMGGMANALVVDPLTEQQGAVVNGLLANMALVLIFVLGLHGMILRAAVDSYVLFPPGSLPLWGVMSEAMAKQASLSFLLALEMSAPFLLVTVVYNAGLGLLSRLMPQMQVYFVAMPVQILLGHALIMIAVPLALVWFMGRFDDMLAGLLAPR